MKIKIKNNFKKLYVLAVLMFSVNYPAQVMAVMKWKFAPTEHHHG